MIASPLTTVDTTGIMAWLKDYVSKETVGIILVGEPFNMDGTETHATRPAQQFVKKLGKEFPAIQVVTTDERMSSKMASRALVDMGMKKKKRQEKGQLDQVAAAMMLQEYLERL